MNITPRQLIGAKAFFEDQLKDRLEFDKAVAAQHDAASMIHPIYLGKMVEPYYRTILALLDEAQKAEPLAEKPDDIHSCSNGAGETKSCGLCEVDCEAREELAEKEMLEWLDHAVTFDTGVPDWPRTEKNRVAIRSLILSRPAPASVTREGVRELVLSYANAVRSGDMNGPIAILRAIGVSVKDKP